MYSTIAVGTDGSETAAEAVRQAADLAKRYEAKLVLLSAFKDAPPADAGDETQWAHNPAAQTREILTRAENQLSDEGIECRTIVAEGDAAHVLVQLDVPTASVYGASMGGRVAQHLAAAHPHLVDHLVLACTSPGGPHARERPGDPDQHADQGRGPGGQARRQHRLPARRPRKSPSQRRSGRPGPSSSWLRTHSHREGSSPPDDWPPGRG